VESFEINETTYTVERARLRLWIRLEDIQKFIKQAVDHKDANKLARYLCLYVSTACDIPVKELHSASWMEVVTAFTSILLTNQIKLNLPFMRQGVEEDEEVPWDYEGRDWFVYANMFAKEYGWSLEYIGELEVEDAFSLFQEILVTRQLDNEWEWSLTDKTHTYNKATKNYDPVQFPRPIWMQKEPKEPKKVKIPKFLIPVGNVISYKDENTIH